MENVESGDTYHSNPNRAENETTVEFSLLGNGGLYQFFSLSLMKFVEICFACKEGGMKFDFCHPYKKKHMQKPTCLATDAGISYMLLFIFSLRYCRLSNWD